MKAQVLHDVADLRYEEVSKPQLKKGWVLVKVKAAGVCGSCLLYTSLFMIYSGFKRRAGMMKQLEYV